MNSTTEPASGEGQANAAAVEPMIVTVHRAFAFDVGDEIALDRARLILHGELAQLRRRRRTPESIGWRPPPVRVEIDPTGIDLPGTWSFRSPPRGELTLFDFGAVSLSVQYHVETTPARLLILAGQLADPAAVIEAARRVLAPWLERIRPAIHDFAVSEMTEEYVVFQLGDKRGKWLDEHAGWIAGLLRLDSEPLSNDEVLEATRLRLAYTPHDLVVLDWAAAVVADSDCEDTLQVIEYANVQLLEFRQIDDRLDDRLESAYRLIRPERGRRWQRPRWRLHGDAVRQIRELEIEATSLFERVDNSLKLIGDHYLARVFEVASTRFHLRGWQQSIRRKLETVGDVYDLLVHQAGGQRMEALEITVVLLITLEIALALLRH